MIHQFDHRWAGYDEDGENSTDIDDTAKRDPDFEPDPRYWVPEREVDERLDAKGWSRGWLMGWRDIARATDERTVIATVFPRTGVGNNLPLMLFAAEESATLLAGLVANLCAISIDFAARHKAGGSRARPGKRGRAWRDRNQKDRAGRPDRSVSGANLRAIRPRRVRVRRRRFGFQSVRANHEAWIATFQDQKREEW